MPEIRTRVATPEYRKGWDVAFGKKRRDPLRQYEASLGRLTGRDADTRRKLLLGDWDTGRHATRSTTR